MAKKPVLRSIATIDENENTYNNMNFKRRKLEVAPEEKYNTAIDDDDDAEEDLEELFQSDEEKIFNSEDDEYYSAISDYESDSKPRFLSFKRPLQEIDTDMHLSRSQTELLEDNLFDTSESESDSPVSPVSSAFLHTFSELKSLEENFQKIIEENKMLQTGTAQLVTPPSCSAAESTLLTVEDFLNYQPAQETDSIHPSAPKQKFLQYRHDERHNLAFPDVSTFPVRYDPTMVKGNTKKVRALHRRAILSGMASEMVGTGLSVGDWAL